MLHLMQLHNNYKESGLEVVGAAADEDAPTAVEARTNREVWLTENCSDLNYRIAFDFAGEMNKLWRGPSFAAGFRPRSWSTETATSSSWVILANSMRFAGSAQRQLAPIPAWHKLVGPDFRGRGSCQILRS
ncbi:hypothetical protein NKI97_31815 [Mesorhizobium sp. M0296]